MSKRDIRLFLKDILDCIEKIEKYIKGMSFEDFIQNDMVVDAVIRNLEIIGEASKNIPEQARSQYGEIPWKRIIGIRNVAIHGYFAVDLEIIRTIVKDRLPGTKPKIQQMFDEIEKQRR